MTDIEILKKRLAEAEDARHSLMVGKSAVSVTSDGDTVQYTRASLPRLDAYIRDLKSQLGMSSGRDAKRIYFG